MRQFNVRIDDEIGGAFYRFCERQGTTPYELINSIVGFYGRGQILNEKAKSLTQDEVLVELGRIIADMKKFAQANGEFTKAVAELLKPHGVTLANLWPV